MKKLLFILFSSFILSNLNSQTLIVTPNPIYQRALASFTIANTDSVSLHIVNVVGKIILTPRPYSLMAAGIYQDSIILDNYPPGMI